jgi:hypothetical protein
MKGDLHLKIGYRDSWLGWMDFSASTGKLGRATKLPLPMHDPRSTGAALQVDMDAAFREPLGHVGRR